MKTLMAVATIGAIASELRTKGRLHEAVAVMLFYSTGGLFKELPLEKQKNISA